MGPVLEPTWVKSEPAKKPGSEPTSYYHLSGAMWAPGAIIRPGDWGRVIRSAGWAHTLAIREMALEDARAARFPHRPSRLNSAFVMLTLAEAGEFRRLSNSAFHQILYRVTLTDPSANSHITDVRLCGPQGPIRSDWADMYWLDHEAQASAIQGVHWTATGGLQLREMLTLSPLCVEERLD